MQLESIFLMADPSGKGGGTGTIIMMVGMVAVFYFFMIRPQAKKTKDQKEFINNLQKGDKVVTIAGIHGIINKVNEDGTVQLEVSPGSYIKIEKSAIHLEWTAGINKSTATTDAK